MHRVPLHGQRILRVLYCVTDLLPLLLLDKEMYVVGMLGSGGKLFRNVGAFVLRTATTTTPWRSTFGRPITVPFTVDASPTLEVNSAMIGATSSRTNGGSGGGAGAAAGFGFLGGDGSGDTGDWFRVDITIVTSMLGEGHYTINAMLAPRAASGAHAVESVGFHQPDHHLASCVLKGANR